MRTGHHERSGEGLEAWAQEPPGSPTQSDGTAHGLLPQHVREKAAAQHGRFGMTSMHCLQDENHARVLGSF